MKKTTSPCRYWSTSKLSARSKTCIRIIPGRLEYYWTYPTKQEEERGALVAATGLRSWTTWRKIGNLLSSPQAVFGYYIVSDHLPHFAQLEVLVLYMSANEKGKWGSSSSNLFGLPKFIGTFGALCSCDRDPLFVFHYFIMYFQTAESSKLKKIWEV